MSDGFYKRLLQGFSRRSRRQKFELFGAVLEARPEDRVLDIGASGRLFTGYTFEDFYPYLQRIVGGGIDLDQVRGAKQAYPLPRYAVFDGCHLPFRDQSFDVVFSNAVIEHVVGEGRQAQFAREIMRVGKSWFVTTPNYWFPFESHYHLPFIQFLPRSAQRTYNRLLGTAIPRGEVQDLALLSARRLQKLFPTSSIARMRLTVWPETLVAYYVDPSRKRTVASG
jgi:SAM-dependent methyltransferase